MSALAPILQELVNDRVAQGHPAVIAGTADQKEIARAERTVGRELRLAHEAQQVVETFGSMATGTVGTPYLVAALSIEHRTILAQIAKAVGVAIQATTSTSRVCPGSEDRLLGAHPEHDGRLTCNTVIGAQLMSTQPLI